MANLFANFGTPSAPSNITSAGGGGGAGGTGGAGQVGSTAYSLVDPSAGASFSSQLGPLLQRIQGLQPPNYQDLVNQGMNSPLLQQVLGPALKNLLPGEELARQNFMDEFRKSGALGSGAMGVGGAKLEGALQGQRGNLISQIISQMLPQITGGLSNQFNQQSSISQLLASVLGMSKPSIVTGSNGAAGAGGAGGGGWGSIPPSQGLNTPMLSDTNWGSTSGVSGGANQGGGMISPNSGNFDLSGLFQPGVIGGSGDYQGTYVGPEGYITPGTSSVYGGGSGLLYDPNSLENTNFGYSNPGQNFSQDNEF